MARKFQYFYSLGGYTSTQPIRLRLPVAATQDIVVGDALTIDGSGELAKAGVSDSIDAIAYEASASQAQGTLIEVEIVQRHHVWLAVASADATGKSRDGKDTYDITAAQVIDIAATTGAIRIIGIDDADNTLVHVQITNPFFA